MTGNFEEIRGIQFHPIAISDIVSLDYVKLITTFVGFFSAFAGIHLVLEAMALYGTRNEVARKLRSTMKYDKEGDPQSYQHRLRAIESSMLSNNRKDDYDDGGFAAVDSSKKDNERGIQMMNMNPMLQTAP